MAWDKTLPLGSKAGNLLDNDIRTNNDGLETAIDAEHTFASGGDQDGRHHFMVDTSSNIEGTAQFVAGALAFSDDEVSGYVVPYIYDGTDWWNPFEPFLAAANDWVLGQFHTPITLTSGANIASDWTNGNVFYVDLAHDGQLDDPDNIPAAGKSGVWYYVVEQAAAGPHQLTYDALFFAPGGASGSGPDLSDSENDVDILMCVLRPDGNISIQSLTLPDVVASESAAGVMELATDAEAALMSLDTKVLTPGNLGSADMGTTTGAVQWNLLGGKHGTYGHYIIQSETITLDGSGDGTFTFAVAFASSDYEVLLGGGTASGFISWSGRTTTKVEVAGTADKVVSVLCYGPIAAV